LFSATIPHDIRGLAHRQLRNPVTVEVDPEQATVDEIEQRFQRVEEPDKISALRGYLDDPACYLALVFRRTTYKVDRLVRDLSRQGYKVGALHGRRSQNQRERVLGDLRSGKLQAVIATDVAARGLDIANLTHVFNYDLPDTPETYVHRIGRTGRAGEQGTAVTFVTPDDEQDVRQIERYLAGRGQDRPMAIRRGKPSARENAPRRNAKNGQPNREPRQHGERKAGPDASAGNGSAKAQQHSRRRRRGRGQQRSSAA
jgi:superfamily II DNA/RNA helicase